ncbi:MAG: Uncharacterized protein AWU56_1203 [Idiomarina sp. T82-3]|nr:MAG: Uncharacterized protein AWU56_1203 [Idiomarina sp. T82-3]
MAASPPGLDAARCACRRLCSRPLRGARLCTSEGLLLHSLAVRSTGKQGLAQAQRAPSQPAGAARIQAQSLLDVIKQAQLIDTRKHLL